MKHVSFAILIAIITLLLSCSFGGSTGSQSNAIWPLSVGSEWQGTMTYYDLDGNPISDPSPMTFYISGDTTVNGGTWYFINSYTDQKPTEPQSSYWLLSNKTDGLRQIFLPIFFRDPGPLLPEQLWFKYPTKVGDGYWVGDYDSITVRSVDQVVNAPQGTRRCVVYDYYMESGYRRYFIAPGIGIVRWEQLMSYDFVVGSDPPVTPGWVWELEKLIIK